MEFRLKKNKNLGFEIIRNIFKISFLNTYIAFSGIENQFFNFRKISLSKILYMGCA